MGFEEVYCVLMEEVIFLEEEGIFLEVEFDEYFCYDFVFKMVFWEFIVYEELELMGLFM